MQKMCTKIARFAPVFIAAVTLTLSASLAHAQTIAVNTAANTSNNAGNFTLGFSFSVTGNQTITGLAAFDFGADGLAESHPIALWNSSQTMLASTTITTANSVALASNSSLGNWRATSITPVLLTPGTYYVAAFYTSAQDRYVYGGPISSVSGFTFNSDAWNGGSSLTFPSSNSGTTAANGGYLGGTIVTGNFAVVPEANTATLLGLTLPMVGGVEVARRRKLAK